MTIAALRQAQSLGHLGLLPFFALAALTWLPQEAATARIEFARLAQFSLAAYSAVILAFLGAVHWGFALSSPDMPASLARQSLIWGVVPSLLGWLAVVLMILGVTAWLVFAILIADLLLVRFADGALLARRAGHADAYLRLRTRLTAGAVLALVIATAASL